MRQAYAYRPQRGRAHSHKKNITCPHAAIRIKAFLPRHLRNPLFEFSGACAGCGDTPYVKLVSKLFGDRMVVANATSCSSIYGGNLPSTPWATDQNGHGPAWANSLFEDNAEFGLGMRLALDQGRDFARDLLKKLAAEVGEDLVKPLTKVPRRPMPTLTASVLTSPPLKEAEEKVASSTASPA